MIRLIFALCCVTVSSISISGQSLEADVRRSFNKFSLVKINDQESLRKARLGIPFLIRTNEKVFQFILMVNEIRSANYRAEYTDANGRHTFPRSEVFTYKGNLIGERNSVVALTVNGTTTEGYLATELEGFFMESARKYSVHAGSDDKVIYQVKDKVRRDDFVCGLDEIVESEIERLSFNVNSDNQGSLRVLELNTEAEKDFVLFYGGVAGANIEILSAINQVDVIFRRQLNLRIVITFQHFWMPGAPDPYAGSSDILNIFSNYWNNNFPPGNSMYKRDVAHMFSLREYNYSGIAYQSTVCNPFLAYSLTTIVRFDKWIIVAHELGHTLDAIHIDDISGCEGTIMLGNTYPGNATQFCTSSVDRINAYIDLGGTCLHYEPLLNTNTLFDFDADGYADISVFRPSNATWYIQQSTAGFIANSFGLATDKLAPADYDGDDKTDIAVFRNGT